MPVNAREGASSPPLNAVPHSLDAGKPIYVQLVRTDCDGRLRPVTEAEHISNRGDGQSTSFGARSTDVVAGAERTPGCNQGNSSCNRQHQPHEHEALAREKTSAALDTVERDAQSNLSPSGLPRVPSLCLLNSDERRVLRDLDGNKASHRPSDSVDFGAAPRGISPTGLGLVMQAQAGGQARARYPSTSPTVPDESLPSTRKQSNASQRQSSKESSVAEFRQRSDPSRLFIQQVLEARQMIPPLEVSYAVPAGAEELLQSATEVNTPSIANTPDLRGLDQAFQETKTLTDLLAQRVASAQPYPGQDSAAGMEADKALQGRARLLAADNRLAEDSLYAALRSVPPALQRLLPYLGSIQTLLTDKSSVATALRNLATRVDLLENASFSYVPGDEFNDKYDFMDGRVTELEGRMDDHDKLLTTIDAPRSERGNPILRRRSHVATEGGSFASNGSFRSNASLQSATSSALIAAAIDRSEAEARLKSIEERLGNLEAVAPPSYSDPWEIEVVFLPWGRDLKGIWFSPDDPLTHGSRGATQESEEWTQTRPFKASIPLEKAGHSGWSEKAIQDWTDTADEWLSPRACGPNSVAYKRLRSRGFVRSITLASPGARQLQTTILASFGDQLNVISRSPNDMDDSELPDAGPDRTIYLGLRAPFIPLRKIHKSSRLRFLTPAEMLTPAIWTAEFLAASVLMRAARGQKRLFVTHRDAYLQRSGNDSAAWNWQKLRELPRRSPEQSEHNINPTHVAEGDAKEACWAYHPGLDPPPSANSSFASNASVHSARSAPEHGSSRSSRNLSLRPAAMTLSASQPSTSTPYLQPITPLSELPPRRPPPLHRTRTVSIPPSDSDAFTTGPQHQPKRRIVSREPSLAPYSSANMVSPSKTRHKRRRTHSPAVLIPRKVSNEDSAYGSRFTPRRSKEPPSPFFSSHPDVRVPSDGGSRSQVTAPPKSGGTPFAYATPHSGPVAQMHYVDGGDTEPDSENEREEWKGFKDEDEDEDEDAAHGRHGRVRNESDEEGGMAVDELDDEGFSDEEEKSDLYEEMNEDEG
ncbi:hypothetical protein H2201_005094 [Coniosporium apollinis]|uniref:Uncharacterized protein n=1 Tax=Coniosporium apollinis TaxID=61459 RepID=A0ABQ9NSH5_9PEZI|nr:hypothetical protein H2201_005094 [Coniosporium apollinis]